MDKLIREINGKFYVYLNGKKYGKPLSRIQKKKLAETGGDYTRVLDLLTSPGFLSNYDNIRSKSLILVANPPEKDAEGYTMLQPDGSELAVMKGYGENLNPVDMVKAMDAMNSRIETKKAIEEGNKDPTPIVQPKIIPQIINNYIPPAAIVAPKPKFVKSDPLGDGNPNDDKESEKEHKTPNRKDKRKQAASEKKGRAKPENMHLDGVPPEKPKEKNMFDDEEDTGEDLFTTPGTSTSLSSNMPPSSGSPIPEFKDDDLIKSSKGVSIGMLTGDPFYRDMGSRMNINKTPESKAAALLFKLTNNVLKTKNYVFSKDDYKDIFRMALINSGMTKEDLLIGTMASSNLQGYATQYRNYLKTGNRRATKGSPLEEFFDNVDAVFEVLAGKPYSKLVNGKGIQGSGFAQTLADTEATLSPDSSMPPNNAYADPETTSTPGKGMDLSLDSKIGKLNLSVGGAVNSKIMKYLDILPGVPNPNYPTKGGLMNPMLRKENREEFTAPREYRFGYRPIEKFEPPIRFTMNSLPPGYQFPLMKGSEGAGFGPFDFVDSILDAVRIGRTVMDIGRKLKGGALKYLKKKKN